MQLPIYQNKNNTGRDGLNILTKIVEKEFNWIVRPNHLENDFGIDAYFDIITEGFVTGKSIAIQIKSGDSYLINYNDDNWKFVGNLKHLNYYLNHDIPVLIIIVDTSNEIAYWEICKIESIEKTDRNWIMPIPKMQIIKKNLRENILEYVSPNVDYVSQLEEYWKENKKISESNRIYIFAGKEDIHNMNYQPLIDLLERICSNKIHLKQFRENIEIGIDGYNFDKRELFEITEVKKWINNIFEKVPGLSYFLVNDKFGQFLKLFMFCEIDVKIKYRDFEKGGLNIEYNSEDLKHIFDILYNDLNDFATAFKIKDEINNEISLNIAKILTGK